MPAGSAHIGKALHPAVVNHERVGASDGASGGGKTMAPALQNALCIHTDARFH